MLASTIDQGECVDIVGRGQTTEDLTRVPFRTFVQFDFSLPSQIFKGMRFALVPRQV